MNYDPRQEALEIADKIPMSDTAIEYLSASLEIAFNTGQLELVKEQRDELAVVTGEMIHE